MLGLIGRLAFIAVFIALFPWSLLIFAFGPYGETKEGAEAE